MRTLQEWMGHRDLRTTLIYADYAPGAQEVDLVNAAFQGLDTKVDTKLSEAQTNSDPAAPMSPGDISQARPLLLGSSPTRRTRVQRTQAVAGSPD
jgi:hypothetical protein